MFGDGSELASRSRNYNYAYGRTREEGEELHAPERFQKQEILLRVERSREDGEENPQKRFQKCPEPKKIIVRPMKTLKNQ